MKQLVVGGGVELVILKLILLLANPFGRCRDIADAEHPQHDPELDHDLSAGMYFRQSQRDV